MPLADGEWKKCAKGGCSEVKHVSEFHKDKNTADGLSAYCRACRKVKNKSFASTRPPGYWRTAMLKSRYGLTGEEVDQMLEDQGGRCPICTRDIRKGFHIDHCHDTGTVRGLLCASCNRALGAFGDNVAGLEKAIDYLKGKQHVYFSGSVPTGVPDHYRDVIDPAAFASGVGHAVAHPRGAPFELDE